MSRSRLLATIAAAALFCAPALAAQPDNAGNGVKAAQPGAAATAPAPAATAMPAQHEAANTSATNGPSGTLHKTAGDWRSSMLVGATVYNEQGKDIGTVDDLLLNSGGKVTQAVLSVGGFLGIGSKLVAVPFDQLKIEPSHNGTTTAANAPAPAAMTGGAGGAATNAGAVGTAPAAGGAANTAAAPAATPAPAAHARPDYSLVLPNATQDSLKSMPSFSYTKG